VLTDIGTEALRLKSGAWPASRERLSRTKDGKALEGFVRMTVDDGLAARWAGIADRLSAVSGTVSKGSAHHRLRAVFFAMGDPLGTPVNDTGDQPEATPIKRSI
jgi:hypothetical protein